MHRKRHEELDTISDQLHAAIACDTQAQKASEMNIEDVIERMKEVEMRENKIASNLIEIQNFFDRPMACINKYRRPALIPKNVKDKEGFFYVYVASIDIVDMENIVYSVSLVSLKNELTVYKTLLNLTYDREMPLLNTPTDLNKHSALLLMVRIQGQWLRCVLLSKIGDTILIEDIDSGKKHSFKEEDFSFKVPQKQELSRNAFAFKIVLTNIIDRNAVDVGDIVKIRILTSNLRDVSEAEIEVDNLEEKPMEIENFQAVQEKLPREIEVVPEKPKQSITVDEKRAEEPPVTEEPRIMINQMKVKNFPSGRHRLTYLDGSKIPSGKIHVCLATEESNNLIEKLFDDIQEYIMKNNEKSGYKPV